MPVHELEAELRKELDRLFEVFDWQTKILVLSFSLEIIVRSISEKR